MNALPFLSLTVYFLPPALTRILPVTYVMPRAVDLHLHAGPGLVPDDALGLGAGLEDAQGLRTSIGRRTCYRSWRPVKVSSCLPVRALPLSSDRHVAAAALVERGGVHGVVDRGVGRSVSSPALICSTVSCASSGPGHRERGQLELTSLTDAVEPRLGGRPGDADQALLLVHRERRGRGLRRHVVDHGLKVHLAGVALGGAAVEAAEVVPAAGQERVHRDRVRRGGLDGLAVEPHARDAVALGLVGS